MKAAIRTTDGKVMVFDVKEPMPHEDLIAYIKQEMPCAKTVLVEVVDLSEPEKIAA